MAPKNNAKGGDKKGAAAKGKGKDAGSDDKSKVKGAQSINVRHILVSSRLDLWIQFISPSALKRDMSIYRCRPRDILEQETNDDYKRTVRETREERRSPRETA